MFKAGSKVTKSVDAYAFGIMCWEVYTSKRAYAGERRSVARPQNINSFLPLPLPSPPSLPQRPTPYPSPLTPHPSPLTPHPSPLTSHPSPTPTPPIIHEPQGLPRECIIERVYKTGLRPRFPSTAPPAFVSLAEACWQSDPAARPTFLDISERLEAMGTQMAAPDAGEAVAVGAAAAAPGAAR
jgi:hypothetical protein